MDATWNSTSIKFGVGVVYAEPVRVTLIVLGFLYIAIGVPGNLLIVYTLLKVKSLRIRQNMFIISLVVANIIDIAYFLPITLVDLVKNLYPGGSFFCYFNANLREKCFVVSFISLLFIAFSRYTKVCRSENFEKYFSKRKTTAACVMPWVFMMPFSIKVLYDSSENFTYNRYLHICSGKAGESVFRGLVAGCLLLLVMVTSWCYWKLLRHTKQSADRLRSQGSDTFSKMRHAINRSFIQSNFIVFLLYVVLNAPYIASLILQTRIAANYQGIALSLAFANCSVNCIIYGLMNKTLRQTYRLVRPAVRRIQVRSAHYPKGDHVTTF